MRVIFSAVISLSTAERDCARQALKGLRNGISCSTGSALALAIVRSYYRLLAAKGDNTASRSGKTQPSISGISRRNSLLAARVDVSGVARDLCPARAPQNHTGTEAGRDVLIAVPPGFSVPPRWMLCSFPGQPVPKTAAQERRGIYYSSFLLTCSLLDLLCFCRVFSLMWAFLGLEGSTGPALGMGHISLRVVQKRRKTGWSREVASLGVGSTSRF